MMLARVSILLGILMDQTSRSARLHAGKGLVSCRKHSNRDYAWPRGETAMEHNVILVSIMCLMMSSPVKLG